MPDLNDVNSLETTAEYLCISVDALLKLARSRQIGALKIGRVWTFPRAAVLAFVEAGTVWPVAEDNPWDLTPRSLQQVRRGSGHGVSTTSRG